ncbi:PREDICTED: villin-1 [Ipomoea nil]|uniref:villin-1 n=1 Tax=Ipomoea nil TaxID=35883 RepID=UPI0009011B2A|nr:PREDICTED: villin-1 [Ipomoea nil]XP_019167800.1 PREDICTED: villin-1 [Ipomoea nil]
MALFGKDVDPAFQGAGAKPGLDIWGVENLQLVPVPKSFHGKFYSGSTYLVLHTVLLKTGICQHDIHYWIGTNAKQVDSKLVSDKALELDAALGSYTVQYREVQGEETEKFLSYFKPCIIPIEGTFSRGQANEKSKEYPISMLTCKGDHVVHVKEVPFTRASLNHEDVFILDTASKIFIFSGCNSSIQERAKALEVVQYIRENKHNGNCDIATIDDGKFVGDPDVGEFWSLFGGYAPIPKGLPSGVEEATENPLLKLFWINTQGKLCEIGSGALNKEMLDSNKCYMLDCNTELFLWMGKRTSVTERKTSISAAEEILRSQGRSDCTHLTFLTEGTETALFRSNFRDWPQFVQPKLYEEGREKVAAIFKHQGYEVKELPDADEDDHQVIDLSGKLKVWRISCEDRTLIPSVEQSKLYNGDCYVIQYTFHNNGREENLFYTWLGRQSVAEDRADAMSHMIDLADSTKSDTVMAQIFEGNEPSLFFLIFKALIVFKGGMSTRYKKFLDEKGVEDDTFDDNKIGLFRIQGTSPCNMQAFQVDHVSSSLNSSYCYILRTDTSTFTWVGNLASSRDHDLLDRLLEMINPTWQPVTVREGNEPDAFWNALGGKSEFSREKEIKTYMEDPQLFVCVFTKDDIKVKEIFNFSQDDLTTEDVLVLNCHREIYVWIGRNSSINSKREAIDFVPKVLGKETPIGKLSPDIPIYIINEGCEPPFFTQCFEWDSSKANMLGNSFERKLAILKGKHQKLEAPVKGSWKAFSMETTPTNSRSGSVGANGHRRRSLSPSISGSTAKSSESIRRIPSAASVTRMLFPGSSEHRNGNGLSVPTGKATTIGIPKSSQIEADANLPKYPYEQLTIVSTNPATDIDITRREAHLSDEEFQEKFGMGRSSFYGLPRWKQNKLKMTLHLF